MREANLGGSKVAIGWPTLPWDGNPIRPGPGEVARRQGHYRMPSLPHAVLGIPLLGDGVIGSTSTEIGKWHIWGHQGVGVAWLVHRCPLC